MSVDKINSLKTIEDIEKYREEINEACDKRAKFVSVCVKANELSNKDFCTIKESFEAISPILFETKEGKDIMNKYVDTIKGSKNLSSLHSLCENIRKAGSESDIDFFVNSIASENWGVDSKTVSEDCKKLGRVLAEGYILINGDASLPKENTQLANAVKFISENKKSHKNIAEYSSAVKVIRSVAEKNEEKNDIFESRDLKTMADELVEEFNQKYSSQLTNGEIDALKEIINNTDRESVFEKYKSECLSKLSEAKDKFEKDNNSSASEKVSSILERVSSKKYSIDTVGNDICGMIELSNIF